VTRSAALTRVVMTLATTLHAVGIVASSVMTGSLVTGRTGHREASVTRFVVVTGALIVARTRALSLTREAGE
jgi:hypothetical protein